MLLNELFEKCYLDKDALKFVYFDGESYQLRSESRLCEYIKESINIAYYSFVAYHNITKNTIDIKQSALKLCERYLVERGIETRGTTGRTIVLPAIRDAINE